MTIPTDRDQIAALLAELHRLAAPSGLGGSYFASVIAETEADLAAPRLGPRRGRSIFELPGGAMQAGAEFGQADTLLAALMMAFDRLPDYFPWHFTPRAAGQWEGSGWRLSLIMKDPDLSLEAPFLVPEMDRLGSWWLFDLAGDLPQGLDLGLPHLARGEGAELGFLPVAPGNRALSELLTPSEMPGLNSAFHFAAFAGSPKPALFGALADLVGEGLAAAPDLTAAEALQRALWRRPSAEMAALFEGGSFTFAFSTGYAEDHLWLGGPV
jgi:hypothetical protein